MFDMLLPSLIASTDPRIDPLEARIHPTPERVHAGQYILFCTPGQVEPVAYLHVLPCLWLGGTMHVPERSHWLYMARIASTRPFYFAALWRAWYAMPEFPALFPVTLITRPTPEAMAATLRVGFAPDAWLSMPGTLTYHAAAPEHLPFASHRSAVAARNRLPAASAHPARA